MVCPVDGEVDWINHYLGINLWSQTRGPFLKSPKTFQAAISGYVILFVSSERRRLEARNFAFILIFIPFTTFEKTGFPELAGRSFTNGFSGPKSFPAFRETGPRSEGGWLIHPIL